MGRFRLIPREERFFQDFVAMAEELRGGAKLLKQMLAVDPPDVSKADAIKEVEHICDGRTRAIIDRLNRTFVTPLDREDIHSLAISLDDVMDAIDAAAAVTRLYKITQVRPGARRLTEIVCDSTDRLAEAFTALEKQTGCRRTCRARRSTRARSRPRTPGCDRRPCSTRNETRSSSSSGRRFWTFSKRQPIDARTSPIFSKASSSSTASSVVPPLPFDLCLFM